MGDMGAPKWPPLNVITPWHPDALGGRLGVGSLQNAATLAPGSNLAHYFPFRIWQPCIAVKMTYPTGTTANGNADVGIYDDAKNRLVSSGAVAQATASTMNEIDITDTTLLPGIYYMAIALSSATGTFNVVGAADETLLPATPILTEALGSAALPATANWVFSSTASPYYVALGVHFNTLV